MKKKLKNIFKINKKEKIKDNIHTETIINLPEDNTTKAKNKKEKTYDYEKLKQKLFKISEKALQKNNDIDKIFKALVEDKKLKAGYKGIKFIFKNPKLAISTLKTIPNLVNDIKKIEEIFVNKDKENKLENQSFLLKLIEDPDSVAFLEKNKEIIKTTISKILPNALNFALKNDEKAIQAFLPLIHQISDKCFDDPKNFMTIANLAVKSTLKMASKNDIQKLFNEVNITPILKDIGIFLSHNDKVGNFLSEIIIKNIESNDTIKKEFLKGINNLNILQDAIPIISKLMGKTLENETDTNKLYEALKPVIFSDFKEKVASASNIEQVKQLDKEEINKYLNVAKILSSSLIKSETFPTIQELITVLPKHKSTTQTILSNSIAIFSNKEEESAKKLSETNKMLDHNEVFETLKSPLNNKHVKYITSNPESLQLVLNMAIETLPKLSEIIQELDKQKELDNILSLMQNISNVKNQDIANKIIDIIETPQNTKIKQILTEDIPNILSKDAKELGTIIDNYLHNTFSGNKFHVKGEKVIEQIAQKLPKLTTIAKDYKDKKYLKTTIGVLKLLADKDVLKLVINTAIDLIKYKIAFKSAKKIGQNIKKEHSTIKHSQPTLLPSNMPKGLAR